MSNSKKSGKIPSKWLEFKPFGKKVEGTMFFPFKTPLSKEMLARNQIPEEERFTPESLMVSCPQVKAIIDLTDVQNGRYYRFEDFDEQIVYRKINVRGGGAVPRNCLQRFNSTVDELRSILEHIPDALIGVHCTHGLNRTGYFICKYMVTKMGFEPVCAIDRFQEARGHTIYRESFVEDIKNSNPDDDEEHARLEKK